ncbi:MAG: GAF domain-containing sensor histidine kinase [Phormidesmis sp.]
MSMPRDSLFRGHGYLGDADRLSTLHAYRSLAEMPESIFDDLTRLAAQVCQVPMATITLVDCDHQHFIARYGVDLEGAPLGKGFCPMVVINGQPLVIPDAAADEEFAQNPAVAAADIRFYAGVPVVSPDRHIVGTVCVSDTAPHQLTRSQLESLEAIARQVISQLELRLTDSKVKRATEGLTQVSNSITTGGVATDGVATNVRDTFFSALVQHLTAALAVDYAYVALIRPNINQAGDQKGDTQSTATADGSTRLETLAVCYQGNLIDNFTYSASAHPCHHLLTQNDFCHHERNLQENYPNGPLIESSGVDSYAAVSIVDATGSPIGVLAVMDTQPLKAPAIVKALLTIFSLRIATELERYHCEDKQLELLEREHKARAQTASASRTKDDFLAVISHELRSPLNPILGWAQLLRRGNVSAERTEKALEVIERNVLRQVELIDDLLDVSRILRGKLKLKAAPVSLNEVVTAMVQAVQSDIEQKSIRFYHRCKADSIVVIGDECRLQQIVKNLLSNAVKFTPEGGEIAVTIDEKEDYAQIQIKDSGRGISPEFLPSIFEHFRQEDYSTIRQFGGLGLGLAIVYHLVVMHKGTVSASSPGQGKGATFLVEVPLMRTKAKTKK